MELQTLRTFLAVVDEGGVLAASRALHTVQSNVTSRIKRLEDELGAELFYRKGRGLELAPSGKELIKHARQMLQLEAVAGKAVRQIGEQTGELCIGTMETFASYRLPYALMQVRHMHPGISLKIETNTSKALIESVLQHKLDCAFVGGPVEHPDLLIQKVLTEELVLIRSRAEHSNDDNLVLFREGCIYRARALHWEREAGHQIQDVMEMGTLDGILGCVSVGLGITLMPRWVVENSRFRNELTMQTLPKEIAMVPTLMVRHRQEGNVKALDTLEEAVTTAKGLA